VIFTVSSVDVYNPKTVRASAGSLFHLPVVRGAPADATVSDLRARGVRVIALDAAGDEDLYQTDLSGSIAFLLGNEAHGLPADVHGLADVSVRVPHAGRAESLNLAAAATVCVFEWARRQRSEGLALESIIAAAAHDIRSPLTAMKGFGSALEQRWAQMSSAQRALMLGGIVYDAERMDTVLRQLVDAARVFEGRFEAFPEQTDVPDLVRQIARMVVRDPEHPSIEWSGTGVSAFVDPARLKTALLAFIESAVWWGQSGPVSVRGSVQAGRLRVSVSRSGTVLSSEGAQNLFLARRPGSGGGSKIGLYIARSVAEAQGGRAWGEVVDDRLVLHLEVPAG
jgi:signal transduction histidine kinase